LVTIREEGRKDEPAISITECNVMKDGYNEKLDTYRHALRDGKQWILQLEQQERENTGIKSLKVGYNRVFGYYIEVRNPHKHFVPEDRYVGKQSLSIADLFIILVLKQKVDIYNIS